MCCNMLSHILKTPHALVLFMDNISHDASPPCLMIFCEKLWFFALEKSPASNKTPDQARPNYTVVDVLLPPETLRNRPCCVFCECLCVWKRFTVSCLCLLLLKAIHRLTACRFTSLLGIHHKKSFLF